MFPDLKLDMNQGLIYMSLRISITVWNTLLVTHGFVLMQ